MPHEQVTSLMLAQLRESPFNPRLLFEQADLQELADSVRQQGVLQPIVVRPVVGEDFIFEIVFGHRRFRACQLAGLETVPTIVRPMTDEEAAVAQIHENLKRRDVSPIEEALGYVRLMSDHRVSVNELVAKTGKSRSYIYARLKLASLGDDARQAMLAGELDAETGVLVARYCRNPKMERQALQLVSTADPDQPGGRKPLPFRAAREVLRDAFCTTLTAAPFDPEAADLLPRASACSTCPKRAGNDPELADTTDAQVCTDPQCYRAKCDAHAHQTVAAAQRQGLQVLEGEAALAVLPRKFSDYPVGMVLLSDEAFVSEGVDDLPEVTFAQALQAAGAAAPVVVHLVHPHKPGVVLQALPDADAVRVLQRGWPGYEVAYPMRNRFRRQLLPAEGAAHPTDPWGQVGSAATDYWADKTPGQRAVLQATTWPRVASAIMQRVALTPRTADDLRLLLDDVLEASDYRPGPIIEAQMRWSALAEADDPAAWLREQLATLGADQLAALLVMLAVDNLSTQGPGGLGGARLAVAARYGVDPVAIAAAVEAAAAEGAADPRQLALTGL